MFNLSHDRVLDGQYYPCCESGTIVLEKTPFTARISRSTGVP